MPNEYFSAASSEQTGFKAGLTHFHHCELMGREKVLARPYGDAIV
jgi:hypothetical protein